VRRFAAATALVLAASCALADPVPGAKVEPVELVARDGSAYKFEPHGVTVLSFFAFWCNTWKQQCPRLSQAMKQLSGFPVHVLTVSVDGRWSNVPGFDPSLPLALDREEWSHRLGVDRVPTTVVLDANGVIRWVKSGVLRTDELVDAARGACKPLSSGIIHLTIANFPPPDGAFQILDDLRRAGCHAIIEPRASLTSSESAWVEKAMEQGNSVGAIRKPGAAVDGLDETRPGAKELLRRLLEAAHEGTTIRLHANVADSRAILPELIRELRAAGFIVG
jgi:hypothetical protein